MRVKVHYMAQLRRAAGVAEESLDAPEGCTVSGILQRLTESRPNIRPAVLDAASKPQGALLIFVNDEQAAADRSLREGDTVTLLTPMAGG